MAYWHHWQTLTAAMKVWGTTEARSGVRPSDPVCFKWIGVHLARQVRPQLTTVPPSTALSLYEAFSGARLNCSHVIRFQSLFNAGKSLVFPCDAEGHVPLDDLSERARENYLYARAVVGREYAVPAVMPDDTPH